MEKRRPVQQAPVQYYDYEEEQATPRPVQLPRPKYAVPAQPQPQQQQFGNGAGVVYAQERPATQYQTFENRQPVQFPAENASPAPQVASRAENQFTLFSPASRADTFRTKVRSKAYIRPIIRFRRSRWRRKRNKVLIVLKKRRRYYN